MADKIATRRGVYLYINGQEIKADIKSVRSEMMKLVNDQAKMTIGSREYVQTGQKIKALDSIIKQHSRQWRNTRNEIDGAKKSFLSLGKATETFNKYFGIVTAFIASLTGLTFAVRKCVDQFAELEEEEANVRKYTGMTREEVKGLNEDLKKMDTRTARTELNKLAADAGRLGLKGKQDILEFVEAANVIRVSLGEDLGDDAVKNIGKLSEMFSESNSKGLKQGMLSTASAINEVAQNSAASEKYLLDFTARMAGTGKQANLSMTQIMGYASVLDQDMQKVEMSATAVQTAIMKMFQTPEKFAPMAGKSVKEFTRLLKEDANEAFLQLLSNLNSQGGLEKLAPIFKDMQLDGVRAAGVLSNLAANVEKIRKEQNLATDAFREGTSATNEFEVKNNTLQATIDKAKKGFQEYSYILGEKLAPHMSQLISKSKSLLNIISTTFDFLLRYGAGIAKTAIVLLAYVAAQKAMNIWANRHNITTALGISLTNTYKMAVSALSVVQNLMAGRTFAAQRAMVAFNTAIKANPIGLLLSAITAGIIIMSNWISKQKEASKYTRQMKTEILQEESAANKLFTALKLAGMETDQRRRLIEEINTQYGDYLENLLTEKSTIDDIRKAQEEVNTAIRSNIALKMQKESLDAIEESALAKQANEIEQLRKVLSRKLPKSEVEIALSGIVQQAELSLQQGKKSYEAFHNVFNDLKLNFFGGSTKNMPRQIASEITDYVDLVYKTAKDIAKEKAKFDPFIAPPKPKNMLPEIIVTPTPKSTVTTGGGAAGDEKMAKQRKLITDSMRKIEESHLKEMSALKNRYLAGDIETEHEYNQEKLFLQDQYDETRKSRLKKLLTEISDPSLRIDLSKQIADIDDKKLDRQIKKMNDLKKILLDADPVAKEKDQYENRLRELDLFGVERENLTADQLKTLELLEAQHKENLRKLSTRGATLQLKAVETHFAQEEQALNVRRVKEKMSDYKYQDELLKLEIKYLNKKLAINGLAAEKVEEINRQIYEAQTKIISNNSDARQNALWKYSLTSLQETKEMELAIIKQYEDEGLLTHEEAIEARKVIDQQYFEGLTSKISGVTNAISKVLGDISGSVDNNMKAEELAITTRYDKEIKAAEGNSERQSELEEEKQKAISGVKSKYADKQFNMFVAQTIASTAVSAMEAYKAMAGIPIVGPALGIAAAAAAVSYGASQISVAKEQRNAAKEGFFKGGYTGGSDPHEIRGYFPDGEPYHGGEFVAAHKTVQILQPMFDVMDYAQKTGNVAALTGPEMASAISGTINKYNPAATSVIQTEGADANNYSEMNQVFSGLVKSLNRLNEKLDEPIQADVSITGEKGFEKKMKEYQKLINNASR